MEHFDGQWLSGFLSNLLEQCLLVTGHINDPPWFTDHDGLTWNLCDIPEELLERLLADAWTQRIALHLATRSDFRGLRGLLWPASPHESRLSVLDLARINSLRDGSFMTRDTQGRFDLSHGFACDSCRAPDSMHHRCLECPAHADLRLRHPAALQQLSEWPAVLD